MAKQKTAVSTALLMIMLQPCQTQQCMYSKVTLAASWHSPDWHRKTVDHNPDQGLVSWRSMTIKWRQFSPSNRHSTISTRQTEYQEALPSPANVQSHLTSSFADDSDASWYSVCRVLMVEWWLDCENCRHLTVVGLHDTGPRYGIQIWPRFSGSCDLLVSV